MSGRSPPEHGFIAYIDEAGDDGLGRVKPIDIPGSSEWLVLSAVVIRSSREQEIRRHVDRIIDGLWRHQSPYIHFAKLNDAKKRFVCECLADLPARYFVVASNKKNMRGYKNPFAEKMPSKNWFYCWMSRLLLERVTDFVDWRAQKEPNRPSLLRIEYSARGGLSYSQMNAYYAWLKMRSFGDRLVLKGGDLRWSVMHPDLLRVYPHTERAGLQLADVVASAFFKACDVYDTRRCDPSFAKLLAPRMARYRDRPDQLVAGYGLKLMPSFGGARLRSDQKEIFRHFGYPDQWWDPDPSNPQAYRPASRNANRPNGRPYS